MMENIFTAGIHTTGFRQFFFDDKEEMCYDRTIKERTGAGYGI